MRGIGIKSALKSSPNREPPLEKERTEEIKFPTIGKFPVGIGKDTGTDTTMSVDDTGTEKITVTADRNATSSNGAGNDNGNINVPDIKKPAETTTTDIMEELRSMMKKLVVKEDIAQLATKSDVKMMVAEAIDPLKNEMRDVREDIDRMDENINNMSDECKN